jgi:hypothetical protein
MKLKFRVDELKKIEPAIEKYSPLGLELEVCLSDHQMEYLFYRIWETVEDDTLKSWLSAEGKQLIDKDSIKSLGTAADNLQGFYDCIQSICKEDKKQ